MWWSVGDGSLIIAQTIRRTNQNTFHLRSFRKYNRYTQIYVFKFSENIYLLLTEFEARTVSYGPSFSPSIYGPSGKKKQDS